MPTGAWGHQREVQGLGRGGSGSRRLRGGGVPRDLGWSRVEAGLEESLFTGPRASLRTYPGCPRGALCPDEIVVLHTAMPSTPRRHALPPPGLYFLHSIPLYLVDPLTPHLTLAPTPRPHTCPGQSRHREAE